MFSGKNKNFESSGQDKKQDQLLNEECEEWRIWRMKNKEWRMKNEEKRIKNER